jgi:hypothetical protein
MLPRTHILLGAIFTSVIWFFVPETPILFLALIFFSSFLIDVDHYICSVNETGNLSLRKALKHVDSLCAQQAKDIKKGIRKKFPHFHFFHTIEFHILVGILGLIWVGFFYIFIGMVFHSLLDVFSLIKGNELHAREYFFFNRILKQKISKE